MDEKNILISIKPYFANKIMKGNKTIELRKKIGKDFKPDSKIIIYSSNPEKGIIGVGQIDKILKIKINDVSEDVLIKSCVEKDFFLNYFKDTEYGYGIYLKNIIKLKNKVPLSTLRDLNVSAPQSFCYISSDLLKALNVYF